MPAMKVGFHRAHHHHCHGHHGRPAGLRALED
jgi:hypothetical protein